MATRTLTEVRIEWTDGVVLVAHDVSYRPALHATLIDPPEQDEAVWGTLTFEGHDRDLTPLLSVKHLDDITERVCEAFRE